MAFEPKGKNSEMSQARFQEDDTAQLRHVRHEPVESGSRLLYTTCGRKVRMQDGFLKIRQREVPRDGVVTAQSIH
jgi:hypothetical protein